MSVENIEEKNALDELLDLYADKLRIIREEEREVAKLKLQIRALMPSFDFMDIFDKPLSEQLDPITRAQREKQES